MSDECEREHTLFIVERDDLDDAVPYTVMKADHPPDSGQAKALEGVMCQLVEEAEAETGEPHRLVTEADTPAVTQRHYEMHEERIEAEAVTDAGTTNEPVDARAWQPRGPRCQCGTPLSAFVAPAEARRLARIYGRDGVIPACPACTNPRSGEAGCEDVTRAIKTATAQHRGGPL